MDPALLREIQRHGWLIESVTETDCVVKCPVEGCGMRTRLKKGKGIPPRLNATVQLTETAKSFDEIRAMLRQRRLDLALSITEVEEAAGMAVDHLAKFERPEFSKIPNLETLIIWAGALGFELSLRPADLPLLTLRTISETRPMVKDRKRRQAIDLRRAKAASRPD